MLTFESHQEPLLSRPAFARRMAWNIAAAVGLIAVSLVGGMVGYHTFEPTMTWVDAFVGTSMILSGMGPVGDMTNDASKIFAGCYALYSGLTLVLATGLILAPLLHRVMHRFHLQDDDDEDKPRR